MVLVVMVILKTTNQWKKLGWKKAKQKTLGLFAQLVLVETQTNMNLALWTLRKKWVWMKA